MKVDYEAYKNKLESQFNQDLREILFDHYITQELGPSVGAKQLGIPRQVFVHFLNLYNLNDLKFNQSIE
ncbi:hypothetical protein QWY14_07955 [Planococcus sp. N028]|uniref:Uncharacterized protein n=1 Tax=Planococcus shixiaomingii TaxID=3058393 RepID=A0ABT8N1F1_9BACL|nr:hypothetical protein [Planococcus sp. N028]MDN7241724.1 hypothetical protein [Planococcus sp. N028]